MLKGKSMNKQQKIVFITSLLLIVLAFVSWQISGGEVFTKTQVLVEAQDEIEKQLGLSHKEWQDKFVLGLDYTLAFSGAVIATGALLFFLFRSKNTEQV